MQDHSTYPPSWRTRHGSSQERTTNKKSTRLHSYRQQWKQAAVDK